MRIPLILTIAALLSAGFAFADDAPVVPRSSSPSGVRLDSAQLIQGGTAASMVAAPAAFVPTSGNDNSGRATTSQWSGGSGGTVNIQGSTSLNVSSQNIRGQAVGSRNTSCTGLGSIGECAPR